MWTPEIVALNSHDTSSYRSSACHPSVKRPHGTPQTTPRAVDEGDSAAKAEGDGLAGAKGSAADGAQPGDRLALPRRPAGAAQPGGGAADGDSLVPLCFREAGQTANARR